SEYIRVNIKGKQRGWANKSLMHIGTPMIHPTHFALNLIHFSPKMQIKKDQLQIPITIYFFS
ncbi:hypothetical protein, partial [Bacillus sp. GbtcB13]|uniref:hypothetical protein n=1 Tax=Bacillus sp. GbtcB13 TaxID=2824758 RepID=UPI001C2F4506